MKQARAYLVDSHCHLDRYEGKEAQILERARKVGVAYLLSVCVSVENFPALLGIARHNPGVYASVGIHPCYVQEHFPDISQEEVEEVVYQWLVDQAQDPKVVALGETGLDFGPKSGTPERQKAFLRAHIRASLHLDLPLIVHMRNSEDVFISLMEDMFGENSEQDPLARDSRGWPKGVMHCFTGTWQGAEKILSWGWYISLSGIVTFPNAPNCKEVAKKIPQDRLLVETDAPWLAPQSCRGQVNEPKNILETAQCVADLRGQSLNDLALCTSDNFFRLFTRAATINHP